MNNDKSIEIEKEWRLLEKYGRILFGNSWQTDLAHALKIQDAANLRAYKRRGVPAHIWQKVKVVAEIKIEHLKNNVVLDIE